MSVYKWTTQFKPVLFKINQILNSDNSEKKTKLFLLTHISKLTLFTKHLL